MIRPYTRPYTRTDELPTFGSLFAGIGGIDLGLERAGWECRFQVEWDPYCQHVLAHHWPDVPRYGDITAVDWSGVERVDLLAGGFPCQPFSNAGKRRGMEDERWLWPEFARAIRELRPRYVLVENVPGLLARHGGMGRVLGDLAELGYDAEWDSIPAAAVGAPHLRYRVWIVAYPNGLGRRRQAEVRPPSLTGLRPQEAGAEPDGAGAGAVADTRCLDGERLLADCPDTERWAGPLFGSFGPRGHGNRRWLPEPDVGRVAPRISLGVDGGRVDADAEEGGAGEILRALFDPDAASSVRFTSRGLGGVQAAEILFATVRGHTGQTTALGNLSLASPPASRLVMRGLWFDGEAACPSCRRAAGEQRSVELADALQLVSSLLACDCGATWVDRTGTTVGRRVQRLRALGNAVVPQVVEVIGRRLIDSIPSQEVA